MLLSVTIESTCSKGMMAAATLFSWARFKLHGITMVTPPLPAWCITGAHHLCSYLHSLSVTLWGYVPVCLNCVTQANSVIEKNIRQAAMGYFPSSTDSGTLEGNIPQRWHQIGVSKAHSVAGFPWKLLWWQGLFTRPGRVGPAFIGCQSACLRTLK